MNDLERRATRYETPCGDGVMVWRAWGEGPPLVILHGGHGSWSHWIRNIDDLARTRRVYAGDLPGFGESANPPRITDVNSFADVVAAGMGQLLGDQAPADLVGFSTGGVVGAYVAALAPELVRRLILVDSGGIDAPVGVATMKPVRALSGDELKAATRFNLRSLMFHHPDTADDLALYVQGLNAPRGRAKGRDLVLPDQLQQVLPKIPVQVDVIWGEHDALHPGAEQQFAAIRKGQPQAELRVVPGAAHWVMYEAPAAFNTALQDLLATPLRRG